MLLAFFAAIYATTLRANGMFMWDEAEYASLGRSVLRGEGFAISGKPNKLRPPVLPLAAAATIAASGRTDDWVVKLPNLVFSLFALGVTSWSARTAYDRTAGLAAAALLGISTSFWRYTPLFLTEIPFMAFFTLAVVCGYFGLHRDPRYFYGSAIGWALAFLTRYTALLFAPIVVVFLAMAWWRRDPDVWPRVWSRHLLLASGLAVALIAPWFIRQQITFGNALAGVLEASTQLQLFVPGASMPWHFYFSRLPHMMSIGVALVALAGAIWIVRTRDGFGLHCLAACLVIIGWLSAYRWKEERLATTILPLLAIVAAAGLTRTFAAARAALPSLVVRGAVLALVFAVNFMSLRPVFQRNVALGYPSFLQGMRWLVERASPQAVVVGANYPQIAWYADRVARDFPDEAGLADALRDSEWVIITNFERGQRPYVAHLVKKVTRDDVTAGDAAVFRDQQFQTVLIRSRLLLERR